MTRTRLSTDSDIRTDLYRNLRTKTANQYSPDYGSYALEKPGLPTYNPFKLYAIALNCVQIHSSLSEGYANLKKTLISIT